MADCKLLRNKRQSQPRGNGVEAAQLPPLALRGWLTIIGLLETSI